MAKQKYTYTYDNALDTFFVKDVDSENTILKCNNELVAVVFIHDMLTGVIDPSKFTETLDMTVREGVK